MEQEFRKHSGLIQAFSIFLISFLQTKIKVRNAAIE